MKTELKKPTTELEEVGRALLAVNIQTDRETLDRIIEEGHLHLTELQARADCNMAILYALMHRLDRAEEIVQRQTRHLEEAKRRAR